MIVSGEMRIGKQKKGGAIGPEGHLPSGVHKEELRLAAASAI
jgi:hypothetical protein